MVKDKKTQIGFENILTFLSIFGFVVIALNAFTSLNLSPWTTFAFLFFGGIGLMIEGRVLTINKWSKDGINGNEVSFIVTIGVGILMIIASVFTIPGVDIVSPTLNSVVGFSAVISIVFIVLQKWVIN